MTADIAGTVMATLRRIPGAVEVAELRDPLRGEALDLERRHGCAAATPVVNLGARMLSRRSACFVLLKDGSFRGPRRPTVYLVEEDAVAREGHALTVDGTRYRVIGEEVVAERQPYLEPTLAIEESFVLFPDRRGGPGVPCAFVLPPVEFPELEARAAELGLSGIISISPSLATDCLIRRALGYPETNTLATLLVGFDTGGRPGGRPLSPRGGPE